MADINNTNKCSSIASSFSGLPLKALIGAPLKAAADANAMVARSQTQFLLSTCFDKDEKSGQLKPIMIEFTLSRQVLDSAGKLAPSQQMTLQMPLMSILPISSLAVEKLKIAFEMDVKSSTHFNHEQNDDLKKSSSGDLDSKQRSHQFATEMHGSLTCSESQKQQAHAKYQIELEAGTLPLPIGLRTMLDVFAKNIAPIASKDS